MVANGVLSIVRDIGKKGDVIVSDYGCETISVVDVAHIQPIPQSSDSLESHKKIEGILTEHNATQIILAGERSVVIELYLGGSLSVKQAADMLGLKKTAFYALKKKYSPELGPVTLIKGNPGPHKGSMRVTEEIRTIITDCYNEHYHGRSASYSNVWKQVQSECFAKGLTSPSRASVKKIIVGFDQKNTYRKKHGVDSSNQMFQPRPGIAHTDYPLQVAQMDHTRVDLLLRAEHDRTIIIGRPWLSVIMDLHTRVILGYYLTMFSPSIISVQQTMGMAMLPKNTGYFQLASESCHYPYFGFPERLLMDNAAEFRSPIVEAAMRKYKIKPEWRKPGKKHMGGHIERLIGTFMTSAVHFLPGTTFSNTQQRGDYDSEKQSALTFKEFCTWFAGQVLVYHGTVHAELGSSPKDAWEKAFDSTEIQLPEVAINPRALYLDFLPETIKPVRNNGITLNKRRYYSSQLNRIQGRARVVVKFDPFDMTIVWVSIDSEYVKVPQVSSEQDYISYEEYRCDRQHNKKIPSGTITDEDALRQMRTNNALVKNSQRSTRNAKIASNQLEANAHHAEQRKHGIPKAVWDAHIPSDDFVVDESEVNFSLTPRLFDQND
ncbi:putative transposase [Pseudomonas sp. 3296]|uniref:Mu transposase C-terminal domain-containing protein n=1 Tax=Pseudomonas sp. 3296 TaxID=2817753 RepID=UPI002865E672|nr:Mu transposase C-terminal domain-containing protein [Pseudomonas sp. 3296]MDR6918941.1 putative transposase [Pseudomonas sp. 3296]